MKVLQKISLQNTHAFTDFFLKYVGQDPLLRPHYNRVPAVESFADQLKDKSSFPEKARKVLVDVLQEQYKHVTPLPDPVKSNIQKLLHKKTFTITTGHQLNIFTGPLYFIYKIVTVVNACRALKARYAEYEFVPVYW